jgi:hypothetical protein
MKKISVSHELTESALALAGARLLIELTVNEDTGSEHDARTAPRAASAILSLVGCRLSDLCRAMRGDLDPATLAAQHNEVEDGPEPDLYLRARSGHGETKLR